MGIELEILIALSSGCSGLLCGWLLCHSIMFSASSDSEQARKNTTERHRLEELASQLQSVTTSVAANVDAHQSKIQKVSDRLGDTSDSPDQDLVFTAVTSLVEANAKMQKQLREAQTRIAAQTQAIETAEELALTDGLTGLNNRRAFDRHMAQRFALDDTDEHPTTFMLIDVDHFKQFNDVYGHRTGDEVLKHVASFLMTELSDVSFVARYGGEEFAVIFDDLAVTEIKDRADEVRSALGQQDFVVDKQRLRITASAGLAQLQAEDTVDAWIERADNALYTAKDEGRDRAYWMDGDIAFPIEPEDSSGDVVIDVPQGNVDENAEDLSMAEVLIDVPLVQADTMRNLPDLEQLIEKVSPSYEKLQAKQIPFCLLAVQILNDQSDEDRQQATLDGIQATIRGTDVQRIGFDGKNTFIICLPNIDESTARERAEAIRRRINDDMTGDGEDFPWSVQIATIGALSSETFDEALHRTMQEIHKAAKVPA